MLAALKQRVKEQMVVHGVGDILAPHVQALRHELTNYCALSVQVQSYLDEHKAAFDRLIEEATSDTMFRGLPFLAYVIVPVQRVARYPLLVQVRFGSTRWSLWEGRVEWRETAVHE